jgi:Flp pilus assembly protein TadD
MTLTACAPLAFALLVGLAPPRAAETPAAREEARRCFAQAGERGVAACRRALALPLGPSRAALVRRTLAEKLTALGRTDEALDVYRDAARARPDDAEAHWRLGEALLALAGDAEGALGPLDRARELAPGDARVHGTRGLALSALGRAADAVRAFEAALHLDPEFLENRPGARAAYQAARRGERWPPPPAEPRR